MPIAYLHVGQHKTGTTSFQYFLKNNRERLAEHGLYVPETGLSKMGAHHQLVLALTQLADNPHITKLPQMLIDELTPKKFPNLLISSETMTRFFKYTGLGEKVFRFFSNMGYTIVPIVVIKDRLPHMVSTYTQVTKTFNNHLSFLEHLAHGITLSSARDQNNQTTPLLQYLEGTNTIAIPYNSTTRQQGTSKTILKRLGVQVDFPIEARLNLPASDAQLYAARWLGTHIENTGQKIFPLQRPELAARLATLTAGHFDDRPVYNPLTKQAYDLIMAKRNTARLNKFARTYWDQNWDQMFEGDEKISFQANDWIENPDLLPAQNEIDKLHDDILALWARVQAEIPHRPSHNLPNKISEKLRNLSSD